MLRRHARAAGYSWRKWEDPILENGGTIRRRFTAWDVLFWVTCAEAAAVVALLLFR